MTIYIINGHNKELNSDIGNALRNNQISKKQGGLLVDENQSGEYKYQIEKILNGSPLPDTPTNADQLPWKENATVIFVGSGQSALAEFEKLVTGFTEYLGPVIKLEVN